MQGSIFVAQCISPTNGVLQVKKIEALTSPILVFINFVDLARCLVDFSLQDARCTHLNYHKIYNQFGTFLVIHFNDLKISLHTTFKIILKSTHLRHFESP
jgi:hypothetical protein